MYQKFISVLALSFIILNTAQAELAPRVIDKDHAKSISGDAIGNGGDGVYVEIEPGNHKFYLLDLVEENNHLDPYFDISLEVDIPYFMRVRDALLDFPVSVEYIALKLTELKKVDSFLAESLLQTIEMYHWQLVHWPLRNVSDEGTWLGLELHQIAIRSQKKIVVQEDLFLQLDEKNRAALVFHEAIYALMQPKKYMNEIFEQRSVVARSINAFLFSKAMKNINWESLEAEVQDFLPLKNRMGFTMDNHI